MSTKFSSENMHANLFIICFHFSLRYAFPVPTSVLMDNDVFVFRRGIDEGKIGILKLMEADQTERCKIHL